MDKRTMQGEATRNLLIQSALELASEGGLQNITAGKLATRARVSKSSVFTHFKTTTAIVESLFTYLIQYQLDMLQEEKIEDLDDFFNLLTETLFRYDPEGIKLARVFLSFYNGSMFYSEIKERFIDYMEQSINIITSQIKCCHDNRADDQRIRMVARMIITTLDGMLLHLLTMEDLESYRPLWKLHVTHFLTLLRGEGS